MSNPTTPFGWQMPQNTDLVTDLPADFEVFGQAVATDLQYLLGGTTGQVLAKTSATDLDFDWVAPTAGDIEGVTAGIGISGGGTSGTVTVTNSMATAIDAKGDLVAGTGADTFAKLTVGANGTTLVADSSEATGLKWATATAAGSNFTLLNSGGTALSGSSTTVSGISGADKVYVVFKGVSLGSATGTTIRFNADTTNVYYQAGAGFVVTATYSAADLIETLGGLTGSNGGFTFGGIGSASGEINGAVYLTGGTSSGIKPVQVVSGTYYTSGTASSRNAFGNYQGTSAISSVSIVTAGTFDAGTMFVYTSA